jgi:hypothetical protein
MSSDNNTSIIIVLASILFLSLIYIFNGSPIHNEGALQMKNSPVTRSVTDETHHEQNDNNSDNDSDHVSDTSSVISNELPDAQSDADDAADSSLEIIRERAMGLDGPYFRRKNGGKYKHNSYKALGAGTDYKMVDRHFKVSDVSKNYTDRFVPVDESDGQSAPINIPNIKGNDKDKYNSNAYLPQEKEKDWFETIETVDIKDSRAINIYRPIGADTIGSTHKGAIYDIRGLDKAVCPKFVVSPWLQSSWEPDRSSKSLCA